MKVLIFSLLCLGASSATGADLPPLNSPATTNYYPGKFVWGDLLTDNPAAAATFYTGLFGWTAATIERPTSRGVQPYTILSVDGRPVAGIAMRTAQAKDKVHARWIGFVSVLDVSRALAAATAGGGRSFGPVKIMPQRGFQAIFSDAEGAVLGVMHSSTGDPGEYLPEPGDWTWAELFARDVPNAVRFYKTVIGYDPVPEKHSGVSNNVVLVSGGYSRAAVSPAPDGMNVRATWLLFVRVGSVRDAVARAVKLGGQAVVPPSAVPAEYWRAVIADPSGAQIGLVELEDLTPAKDKP